MSVAKSSGGKRPFRMVKGVARLQDLADGNSAMGFGVGNVYYVIKSNESHYSQFLADYQGTYSDGSAIVHAATYGACQDGIQAALDACVECRNDYVVIMPSDSDYDITAALTMSKKCVHLICPAGFGYDRGATNAARLEQLTAATAIIAVSDASIEIAGLYFKNYLGCSAITLAATSYAPNIHHNSFMVRWTTTNDPIIACSGDAGAWGSVAEHNWFISQSGDDQTAATVITVGSSATGARVNYNDFFIGDGNTATAVVSNAATKGTVNFNNFQVAAGDGTITHAIAVGAWGSAIGNRVCTATDGTTMSGGTVDISFVDNMHALNGGTIDDAD